MLSGRSVSLVKQKTPTSELSKAGKSDCPYEGQHEEEEYFNAAFFLEDKEGEALYNCTGSDMITIGEILRNVTAQVDEAFPDFVPEVITVKTEVCILPCVWAEPTNTNRRRLRSRYTFKSGGTCRRCTTSRRRLAVDMFKQLRGRRSLGESTPAEMAKEACDFAEVSQFAYDEAKVAVKQVGDILKSMEAEEEEEGGD